MKKKKKEEIRLLVLNEFPKRKNRTYKRGQPLFGKLAIFDHSR